MSDEYLRQVVEHLRTCAGHRGALRAAHAAFESTRRRSKLMRSLTQALGLDWRDTQEALTAVRNIMVLPMAVARESNQTLLSQSDLERIAQMIFMAFVAEDDVTLAQWLRETKNLRKVSDDPEAVQVAARSYEESWLRRIASE